MSSSPSRRRSRAQMDPPGGAPAASDELGDSSFRLVSIIDLPGVNSFIQRQHDFESNRGGGGGGSGYKRARIPASDKAIEGLRKVSARDAGREECAVCLQDFDAEETLRAMPCSHAFHERCIFDWLHRNAVCPLCRHKLPPSTEEDDEGAEEEAEYEEEEEEESLE